MNECSFDLILTRVRTEMQSMCSLMSLDCTKIKKNTRHCASYTIMCTTYAHALMRRRTYKSETHLKRF